MATITTYRFWRSCLLVLAFFFMTACGGGGGDGQGSATQTPKDNNGGGQQLDGDDDQSNDDDQSSDEGEGDDQSNDEGKSDDDSAPTDDTGNTPPISDDPITENGVDLSGVALQADTAQVFQLLRVDGLPEGATAEEFFVEYRLEDKGSIGPGVNDSGLAPLIQIAEEDEDIYLVVPLANPDGASLNLKVTDGSSYSRTLKLGVAALPEPEEGAFSAWLDATEVLIAETTEAYGLTYPDDLQAYLDTPQSLDVEFLPLVLGYHSVANPNNPNSLRQMEYEEEEIEALERLIPHMNLVKEAEHLTTFATSDQGLIDEAKPHLEAKVTQFSSFRPQAMQANPASVRVMSSEPIPTYVQGVINISGPEHLAELIEEYNTVRTAQEHVDAGVKIAGRAITVVGIGAAFAVSGPGGGAAAGAAGTLATAKAAATVVTLVDAMNGATTLGRGLMPCCINTVDMKLLPESGIVTYEDEDDPSLFLEGATAGVSGDAIDITKEVVSRVVNHFGGNRISKKVNDRFGSTDLDERLINTGTGEVLSSLNLSGQKIVFHWPAVDISGNDPEQWLSVELEGFGGVTGIFERAPAQAPGTVSYQLNEERFFGNESANDVLSIEPRTDKFPFGRWQPPVPRDSRTIGANTMRVVFDPAGIKLEEPGEVVPFTVRVENAKDTEIELPLVLEPEIGSIERLNNGEDGIYEFEYTAPEDELPAQTLYVKTKALSERGVRGRAAEPAERRGTMRITTDAVLLEVAPGSVCLEEGDSETFTATDPLTGDPVDVEWSANMGRISAAGTFTAPAPRSPGYATITATTKDADALTATARVTLGCHCWWSGSVTGQISQRHSHDTTSIFYDDNGAVTEIMYVGGGEIIGTRIALDSPIPAGETGTYQGRTSYGNLTTLIDASWNNRELFFTASTPPLTVTVTRHEMMEVTDDIPEGSRHLELNVSGMVAREIPTGEGWDVRTGYLELEGKGMYWYPVPMANMLNCSYMP